jgi:glycosyltransferase involved in cell wall biosynthesis
MVSRSFWRPLGRYLTYSSCSSVMGAERKSLEARASDLDNVVFTGLIPKSEVPGVLATADAALVHLKPRDIFETVLPSKQLEAMAAGLPVLLGVRGEAERILSEADAGIAFAPGDPTELAEAIKRLRTDPKRCRTLGENGRMYANAEFDWDGIAADYLATLTDVE